MNRAQALWGALAALLLTLPTVPAAAPADGARPRLAVCVDADNPPFSSPEAGGIDVDIARALAERLQRELALRWVQVPARGGLGKALRASIQAGQCELFMGLPDEAEMTRELAERKLQASRPYLAIGYLLVSAAGASGTRIGAVTATPADLYLHRQKLDRVPYGNNRALIDALRAGDLHRALLWTPAIARYLQGVKAPPLRVEAAQPKDASLRTGLVIAVRGDALLAEVDRALDALATAGRLAAIAEAHALSPLPPI